MTEDGHAPLRRLCLIGVSGLGKTTLLRSLQMRLPGYACLTGSAVLRALAGEEFARFDHLPAARKQHFREEAIRHMATRQEREGVHLLCEGHTTLRSRHSGLVEPVFTELDTGFFRELILLDAEPELVCARRAADTARKRPVERALVDEELCAERAECVRIAAAGGLRLHRFDAAQADLAERLLQLLGGA